MIATGSSPASRHAPTVASTPFSSSSAIPSRSPAIVSSSISWLPRSGNVGSDAADQVVAVGAADKPAPRDRTVLEVVEGVLQAESRHALRPSQNFRLLLVEPDS